VTPYVVIAALVVAATFAAWRLPETVTANGARFTLTPQVPKVPRSLWRAFGLSALGVIASWSVGGLYLSLGPGIVGNLFGTENHAVGGAFVFVFSSLAVVSQWFLRGATNRTTLVGGATALAIGSVITAVGVSAGSTAAFLVGSVLVGFGFGGAFMGAIRSLSAVLPPAHRASVMSAFFVVAYAAISVPAVAAGVAAVHIGLDSAATWFGFAVAVVAALVAVIGWFELRPARAAATAPAGLVKQS
jgi:MFS family permease